MKISNVFGNRYSGTLGKDLIASSWKGIEYLKEYKIPRDPKSERQLLHRTFFAEAVKKWHALEPGQRQAYNKEATKMTGYNLFIKNYIKAAYDKQNFDLAESNDGQSPPVEVENMQIIEDARELREGPTGTVSQRQAAPPMSPVPEDRKRPP